MALPIIEYNYYKFIPVSLDPNANKYQILVIKPGRCDFTRNNVAETRTGPLNKFPLGRDLAILNLYRMAYVVSSIVCIIAAFTLGSCLLSPDWSLLKALIVVVISTRYIHYLEWKMKNKSFEIAAKIVCTFERRDCLFDRSEYKL